MVCKETVLSLLLKMKLNVQRYLVTVAFGASTMSRTQNQLWYNRYKECREDVNDVACPVAQTRRQQR